MTSIKPKRYRFLSGPDTADFCQRVSDALDAGYQLYGSPVMISEAGQRFVGQAVIWPDEQASEITAHGTDRNKNR